MGDVVFFPGCDPNKILNLDQYCCNVILIELAATAIENGFELGPFAIWREKIVSSLPWPTINEGMTRAEVDKELIFYREVWRKSLLDIRKRLG